MVNSILNPKINFPELKKLDPDDKQFDASMYEVNILGEDVIIALGQAKYAFIDDNIIYYPIYLVKNDKVSTQIGVYEILAEQLPNVVDDDGDIDLTQVDEPLLYKFVNDKILFDSTNDKRKDKLENITQVTYTDVGIVRCQVSHAPFRIWCHGVLFPNGFSFGFFV